MSAVVTLYTEYVRLIQETDDVIDAKRLIMVNSATNEDAAKWKASLDRSLDHRSRLMLLRNLAEERKW